MNKIVLILYGIPVSLCYQWFPSNYIEWHLDKDRNEITRQDLILLETLLRVHHSDYIQRVLRDEHQAQVYEEDSRAAARAENYSPF